MRWFAGGDRVAGVSTERLWVFYLLVAVPVGLLLGVITPPFQVNDEFQHFSAPIR